jgi:hypothetical protein
MNIRRSAGKRGRHLSQRGALPPPLSQRTYLIAAAYRRGCVAKPDLERRVRPYLGDHQLAL